MTETLKQLTLLLLIALPASGYGKTDGFRLLELCKSARPRHSALSTRISRNADVAYCEGFITAISESRDGMSFCRRTAADRSPGFEREVITDYLSGHPERLKEPATDLVLQGLERLFPCVH